LCGTRPVSPPTSLVKLVNDGVFVGHSATQNHQCCRRLVNERGRCCSAREWKHHSLARFPASFVSAVSKSIVRLRVVVVVIVVIVVAVVAVGLSSQPHTRPKPRTASTGGRFASQYALGKPTPGSLAKPKKLQVPCLAAFGKVRLLTTTRTSLSCCLPHPHPNPLLPASTPILQRSSPLALLGLRTHGQMC